LRVIFPSHNPRPRANSASMRYAYLFIILISVSLGCESANSDRTRTRETTRTRTTETYHEGRARDSIPGNEPVERTAAEARNPNPLTTAQRQALLEQHASAVANATTRDAQSIALRQLWQHLRDNNYTYQTSATRLSSGAAVTDPASAPFPIRVNMIIFQADRRLYDFSFNPLDNSDLSFLTPGGATLR
jgi:hypothetical protein